MRISILNKKRAFTIAETLMALVIIAVIMVLTIVSTLNSGDIQSKKTLAMSKMFYSNVDLAYQNILTLETRNYNIQNIKNYNTIYNTTLDSEQLKNLFAKHMNLTDVSCDELDISGSLSAYKNNDLKCASTDQKIIAGFYLDRKCTNTYQVIEYLQKDKKDFKTVENACGYIIYGNEKSKSNLGQDTFIIALGKLRLK